MKFLLFVITIFIPIGPIVCEISDERLQFIYNHPKSDFHIKDLVERYIIAKRFLICMKHFNSRLVCENKATWFMWAQILAKDIMEGKYPK